MRDSAASVRIKRKLQIHRLQEVELPDGAQGVHIRGISVVVLVLDEAGELVELGDELPQHAELVHQVERGVDRAELGEDGVVVFAHAWNGSHGVFERAAESWR